MDVSEELPAPRKVEPIRIEVILVGGDLLAGDARDEQLKQLASFGRKHGGMIGRATIIPHDLQAVSECLREANARQPDLIVTVGGLGPALRDCTMESVSDVFDRPLSVTPPSRKGVEEAYTRLTHKGVLRSAGMNMAREKLCQIPIGSTPLKNDLGISNGLWLRVPGRPALLCLPGMPREAETMLSHLDDEMRELRPRPFVVRREIESPTPDEAELQPLVEKLAREFPQVKVQTRPTASARKGSNVRIILESHGSTEAEVNGRVGDAIRRLIALQSGS